MTTKTAPTRRTTKAKPKPAPKPRRNAKPKIDPKWIRTVADRQAIKEGCTFEEGAVEHVVDFFRHYLRHGKGKWASTPFELLPWEVDHVIGPVFGWMRPDGTRRIRKAYIEIAKKNGKSALGSGIGIYMAIGDGEEGAEVYSAGTKREQAAIVHREAIRMVKASTPLTTRLRVNESTHVIFDDRTSSRYATLSADAAGSEGLNIHAIVKDELHVWTNRPFFDSLEYGSAARSQPLDFTITTAGVYNPESIGYQEHDYAVRFLAGDYPHNTEYHAYICAADPLDDILDPEVHKKANPSYGVTIDPAEIMKAARDAKDRPSKLNAFLRYRLNVWTAQLDAWLPMDKWQLCGGEIDEAELRGRTCFGGLDLASRRDLASFALVFPPTGDGEPWDLLVRNFAPKEKAVDRERVDGVPYLQWGREGWLTLTPGESTDYEVIQRQIIKDSKTFNLQGIGADKWNLEFLRQKLEADGLDIVEYGQGLRDFSAPSKEFEALIVDQNLRHGDNPILNWAAGHVTIYEDGNGNIRPDKKKSTEKIDPIVASIMALGMAMVGEEATIYDSSPVEVVGGAEAAGSPPAFDDYDDDDDDYGHQVF